MGRKLKLLLIVDMLIIVVAIALLYPTHLEWSPNQLWQHNSRQAQKKLNVCFNTKTLFSQNERLLSDIFSEFINYDIIFAQNILLDVSDEQKNTKHFIRASLLERKDDTYLSTLIASRAPFLWNQSYSSNWQDWKSRATKPVELSSLSMANNAPLTLVVIDQFFFSRWGAYQKYFSEVNNRLHNLSGPMIVTGDFHTWNSQRKEQLQMWLESHALKPVPALTDKVQVYYRQLMLKQHRVLKKSVEAEFCVN